MQKTGRDFWHLLFFLRTNSTDGQYPSQLIPILYSRDLVNFLARYNKDTVDIVSNIQPNAFRDFMSSDGRGVILHNAPKDYYLQVEYYSQEEFEQVIDAIKWQIVVVHEVNIHSPLGVQETIYCVVSIQSFNVNQYDDNNTKLVEEAITISQELSRTEENFNKNNDLT